VKGHTAAPKGVRVERSYRYRIYPTRLQAEALSAQLGFCCDLYNAALEQRRDVWRWRRRSVRYEEQSSQLTEVRRAGMAPAGMNAWTQQQALVRLDRAFQAFFRRCKADEKPGYPRFRSESRYDSLAWSFSGNAAGVALVGDRLRLQGVGHVKVKWHRALPDQARLRTATVVRHGQRWEACFSLEVPVPEIAPNGLAEVGLDIGITTFAALSTGEIIAGPRSYRAATRRLRVAQRRVARRKRGSRRQRKARAIVRREHERIANVRRDHAHKVARDLVSRFETIYVEDLSIRGLARGMLAKDINDQGWGAFLLQLDSKAECAGCRVVRVNPRNTSQGCSDCGALVPKGLSVRVHRCPECGLVLDRDVNAACNLLRLGRSLQAITVEDGPRAVA